MRWWSASRMPAVGVPLPQREVRSFTPKSVAANDQRVVETGQASASVGRMVISGRMADVCAELDRLAAREAALS